MTFFRTFSREGLFLVLWVAGLTVYPMGAQVNDTTGSDPQSSESQPGSNPTDRIPPPTTADSAAGADSARTPVPALAGGKVVWLEDLVGEGLLYGVSAAGGHGWGSTGSQGDFAGTFFAVEPYLGFFEGWRRTKILFQYLPTISVYEPGQWGGGVFQRASLDGSHMLTQRLAWTFSGLTTYGTESSRQLGSLGFSGGSGTIGGLTYGLLSDTLLLASGSTGLSWQRTPRRELSFTVTDAYSSASHGGSADAVAVRAEANNKIGRQSTWHVYALVHHYLNEPGCTLYGVGAGFASTIGERTSFGLEAGPQFGGSGCGVRLGAGFSGSLRRQFSSSTTASLSAGRDLFVPYLIGSRWADNVAATLRQKVIQTTSAEASASYVRTDGFSGAPLRHYQGYLLSSEFRWRATDTVSVIGSYRYFRRDATAAVFPDRRNWIVGEIEWRPTSRGLPGWSN